MQEPTVPLECEAGSEGWCKELLKALRTAQMTTSP
jgi:hypothetical protein